MLKMPAARRFPGLELSFPLLARLRRRLYTVSVVLGRELGWLWTQPLRGSTVQRGKEKARLRDTFLRCVGWGAFLSSCCIHSCVWSV